MTQLKIREEKQWQYDTRDIQIYIDLERKIESKSKTMDFSKCWFTVSNTKPPYIVGNFLNRQQT